MPAEEATHALTRVNPGTVAAPLEDRGGNFLTILPTKQELEVLQTMAETANGSKFYQNMNGLPGVMAIMLYARELGCPPMIAISGGFHNIQGKVEMSARMMNLRIRQCGHLLKIKEATDKVCTVYGKRKDNGEDHEVTFTIENAQKMALVKTGSAWEKTPDDMLFARALSRLARRLFPDVIGSAYAEGEIQEAIDVPFETVPPGGRKPRKARVQTVLGAQEQAPTSSTEETPETTTAESTEAEVPQEESEEAPETGAEVSAAVEPVEDGTLFPDEKTKPVTKIERSPIIEKDLNTLFTYLRTKHHVSEQGMGYARELLRGEFAVKEPEDIPETHAEAMKKFCKTELLRLLQQENYIPMTRG